MSEDEKPAEELDVEIHDPLADLDEDDDAPPSPLRTFLGLFVVPLLVVLACVAVFVGFGWIAYDQSSTEDYLNDLRSAWRPRRAQAAYELAKVLIADPAALDDEPETRAEVRTLFSDADSPEMRRYLALVLGYTRDTEAVPLLLDTLDDPNSETRIYAIWALGTIGDSRALAPLTTALRDSDPGIRKTAAFSLGEAGFPEAAPALRAALGDVVADVRWNAALALTRLGSPAGVPVLEEMLDRQLVGQVPGITPEQQEDAMIEAVQAIAAIEGEGARQLLDRLAESDPSLKVRQAAIDALEALDERAGAN